ncbi:hypothetical protein P280DRAFT_547457 [Massarina eburnea CBS 473.64]|uniref:Uncharacterized protein n=1 Tax=Massarina eburnea CBS 473.64 TaxID=1395130 RepID=A0A6A6S7U3_9PLEO|nr:hypothetical protein P280DRAFT_547457 [Massarina eburnea CBS 473.64]
MAPIRRYLRITKHSVLEVRIYLDRPSDANAWLLRRDNPVLPRVIQAVRPLVLPKLREENERARGKGGGKVKKKGVKDVVVEGMLDGSHLTQADFELDDFEVSIFLTELSSRHSILTKQKVFKDKPRVKSNSAKLTGWLTSGTSDQPMIINEEDEAITLADIPEAGGVADRGKRRRGAQESPVSEGNDSDDPFQIETGPWRKRSKKVLHEANDEDDDGQKKLSLNTSYEGFSIYGRILCLVVKRKDIQLPGSVGVPGSQQMMENWVSTQAAAEQIDDDEDHDG